MSSRPDLGYSHCDGRCVRCPALTCKPGSASVSITSPRAYFPILQGVILVPMSKIGASHPAYDGRIPQSYKPNDIDSGNSDVLEPWLHLVYQPSLSLFYLYRIYLPIHLFKISCALLDFIAKFLFMKLIFFNRKTLLQLRNFAFCVSLSFFVLSTFYIFHFLCTFCIYTFAMLSYILVYRKSCPLFYIV